MSRGETREDPDRPCWRFNITENTPNIQRDNLPKPAPEHGTRACRRKCRVSCRNSAPGSPLGFRGEYSRPTLDGVSAMLIYRDMIAVNESKDGNTHTVKYQKRAATLKRCSRCVTPLVVLTRSTPTGVLLKNKARANPSSSPFKGKEVTTCHLGSQERLRSATPDGRCF